MIEAKGIQEDEHIEKYVSLSNALRILEIDVPLLTIYDKRVARVILLDLKIREKSISRKPCYHIDDIYKTLKLVSDFFDNYYVTEDINTIPKAIRTTLPYVKIPSGYNYVLYNKRYPNKEYKRFTIGYKKAEADEYLKQKDKIEKNYIPVIDAVKILQYKHNIIDNPSYRKMAINNLKKLGIELILVGTEAHCNIKDVNNVLEKVRLFFDEHYVIDEIPYSKSVIKRLKEKGVLTPVEIPIVYNAVLLEDRFGDRPYKTYSEVYKKSEVDQYIQLYNSQEKISANNYLELEEVLRLTNYREDYFFATIQPTYCLSMCFLENKKMFIKSEIEALIIKQKEFFTEYIDSKTASKKFIKTIYKDYYAKHLKVYNAPPFAFTKDVFSSISTKKGVYKISEIIELMNKKHMKRLDTNLFGETPFETFKLRLNHFSGWTGFGKESQYTENKWFNYVKNSLGNTISKGNAINTYINCYVKCTLLIKDMLEKNGKAEIYMLTAPEINLFKRTLDAEIKEKAIYNFVKEVYEDILCANNNAKQVYRMSDIENPKKRNITKERENRSSGDTIYGLDEYCSVFQYTLETDFHTEKSLEEIENSKTCIYASTWLYTMLHLNNAWRHGDVRDFPKIELSDLLNRLDINDFEWFKINKISLPQAREIIERVRRWEFIISKTQMKGRFFCSDELAISFATAVVILTLFEEKYIMGTSNVLMSFYTKYNDISEQQLEHFFGRKEFNEFKFASRKFNKTVMTYITYLANLSGDKKAIEYAKWIRSHVSIDSTLHYIDFNVDEVENLSRMLFARGEFGYVTALLLGRLNKGNTEDFGGITEQICSINKMFGDTTKLNATVGFLNTVRSERELVVKYINQLTLKECQERVTDLFTRKLPSKNGEDVQCLFSKKGCQKQNFDNCFECPFHIPSIYALTSLCESIKQDFERFNISQCQATKIKVAIKIHRKNLVLIEAIDRFGEEYVFGCLGISVENFIDLLSEIPNPMELK